MILFANQFASFSSPKRVVRSFVRSFSRVSGSGESFSESFRLTSSLRPSFSFANRDASRVGQTHFLPPSLVLVRESRMPAESVRLTSSLRPSFSFANRECQPSRSDSLPPSFTTFKRITNAQCSSHGRVSVRLPHSHFSNESRNHDSQSCNGANGYQSTQH